MAAEEGIHEGVRKGDVLDDRHQAGLRAFPEWCLRKVFAPEDLPAGDGLSIDAEAFGKLTGLTWRRPLPQSADQDQEGAQVDLPAEEAHRGWCRSLPAAVATAAEAQPDAQRLGQLDGGAPGLPKIVGTVEGSAAGTAVLADRFRKVLVDGEKDQPEPGGARQIVVHGRVLRTVALYEVHPSGTLI